MRRASSRGPQRYREDSVQWVAPSEAWEPRVVTVRRHPHASALDRESREVGVRDEVAFYTGLTAEPAEELPAALRWYRHRRVKPSWLGDHMNEATQDEIGHSVRGFGFHHLTKASRAARDARVRPRHAHRRRR